MKPICIFVFIKCCGDEIKKGCLLVLNKNACGFILEVSHNSLNPFIQHLVFNFLLLSHSYSHMDRWQDTYTITLRFPFLSRGHFSILSTPFVFSYNSLSSSLISLHHMSTSFPSYLILLFYCFSFTSFDRFTLSFAFIIFFLVTTCVLLCFVPCKPVLQTDWIINTHTHMPAHITHTRTDVHTNKLLNQEHTYCHRKSRYFSSTHG